LLDQQDEFRRVLPNALAEVALVAAQQNAIDDAMRLWRKSTNLDRRNLEILAQLAQTKAHPGPPSQTSLYDSCSRQTDSKGQVEQQ
jgi:Tfp pilus assembly protein PilF